MRNEVEQNVTGYRPADDLLLSCSVVLKHVAVGIYAVNQNGICTSINPAALALLGYTEEECIGVDMHELAHARRPDGSSYPRSECPLYQARITGLPVHNLEEVLWNKTGAPVRLSCSSVPLADENGVHGTVITLNDLTSRLDAEHRIRLAQDKQTEVLRLRDAALDMEKEQARLQRGAFLQVERAAADELQRQQQLAEDRLVQSEKLAAVGRLMASISHEINNPLEAVTNLLYLVRHDSNISGESDDYLRQAEQELARVSEIVSQTLRFQRGTGAPTDCKPDALVDSVVALHQGRLHHSNIRIDRQHRSRAAIRCPEGDIRQILNNLIGNAIDAMQKEGGVITIRTAPAHHPRTGEAGFRISVSDTGHGMNGATAAQIFDPFYTTKGADGSGLGLWISSAIAKRHGGHLSVRSKTLDSRRGTTFSLFVPQPQTAA